MRMARAYGTRMINILGHASSANELGPIIAGDLYEAELRYLLETEFAILAQDVLYRRSKLYLHLTADEQQRAADWIAAWHDGQLRPA